MFTVKLIVNDIFGCTDTITKPLYINVEGPDAGFTTAPLTACANTPIVFTDTSSANTLQPIVSWTWDYGDGITETLNSGPFAHAYKQPGNYTVVLTVEDNKGCSDQAVQYSTFTISQPVAQFESQDLTSCTGKPIRFNNYSTGNISSYQWWFGDGRLSGDHQPLIQYLNEGTFDIKLVTTDFFGCTDTLIKPAYINIRNPNALFTVSDSVATCPPLVTRFTNLSENFNSYEWNFGDNTRPAPTENPSHFYAFAGTYTAKLKVTSPGGCMDSLSKILTVKGPEGEFTYNILSGCKPLMVSFKGTTTSNASFVWDYNDGLVEAGESQIMHSYTSMGSYLPKMILVDPEGCRVPIPGPDTIRVLGAEADFISNTNMLCDSGLVNFTNLSTANEKITRYKWTFDNSNESLEENPGHFFRSKGEYPVQLIVTTQSGCTDTLMSEVPVKVAEKPVVYVEGDTLVCMPATIQFKGIVISNDTSALKWQWDFGNGVKARSQFPVSAIYKDSREYNVQAIATNSTGCSDTVVKTVKPLPLPTVNAGEDQTIAVGSAVSLLASYSHDVTSLAWTPYHDLSCSACKDPVASPKKTTTYSVEVTNEQGCTSRDEITIFVFCDAGNLFMPNTFSPNGDGVNDVFYPRGKGLFTVKTLRIFNRWGEVVFEERDFNPNDITKGWKGMHNNRQSPQDVYVYSIDLICENKTVLNYKGNVALIR
jgi:gliding motility-associated-like protein